MKRFWLFIGLLLAASAAQAADYPPYPDVWGRELAAPQGRIVNGFYLRAGGNGDYVITHTHHAADPETGNLQGGGDWSRLDFFAGTRATIDEDGLNAIQRDLPFARPRVQSRGGIWLHLPGEIQVKPFSREPKGVGCWVNYAGSLVLRDRAEKVIADRVALRLLAAPERREYWDSCERGGTGGHYEAKVDALSFALYGLKDGTFLAEGASSPFLIRFYPDLTSPFVEAHPDLFLVDTAEVDRVVKGAYAGTDGVRIQAANDALHAYVLELRRRKIAR